MRAESSHSLEFSSVAEALAVAIGEQGIPVDCDWSNDSAEAKLERELEHYLSLRNGEPHDPHVWLWSSSQCLVATRLHSRNEKFEHTAQKMGEFGWPVAVRRSGGTVVPHGPGILNLSLFHVTDVAKIEMGYQPLVDMLIRACASIGIEAHSGSCSGSFCDGAFNLLVNGRKVAGTAAMLKRQSGISYWLAHATIMVDTDIEQAVRAVTEFEQALGLDRDYLLDAHTNLNEHLSRRGTRWQKHRKNHPLVSTCRGGQYWLPEPLLGSALN